MTGLWTGGGSSVKHLSWSCRDAWKIVTNCSTLTLRLSHCQTSCRRSSRQTATDDSMAAGVFLSGGGGGGGIQG